MYNNILTYLIFIPLIGSALMLTISIIRKENNDNIYKWIALIATGLQLLLTILLLIDFDPKAGMQFEEQYSWIPKFGIEYYLGVDGLSIPMVFLTSFLSFICIIASWNINKSTLGYFSLFLMLDTGMMGVFVSLDFFLFYVFWEVMLLPMYFLIGIWGGPQRTYAAIKFFLYTLFGSVFMLLGMLALYFYSDPNTFNLITLIQTAPQIDAELWGYPLKYLIWLALFIGFAIKVPVFPFHTWLPLAHVEAPTVGSIILAGILLKVGGYAFIRISLPILPYASYYFSDLVIILSIIAIIYTSFVAFAQNDMKKMIAYSSVAHMGYVTAGIFSLTEEGIKGGIFQMVSHGIVSSALFLSIGVLYEQTKSRSIESYSFIVKSMPLFSLFFIVIVLSSIGLPGTSGFIGELLSIVGVFKYNGIYGFFAGIGLILGAVYMLNLVRSIIFKKTTLANNVKLLDVNISESFLLFIFVFFTMVLGVLPNFLLQFIDLATLRLLSNF